jgi:hypothetical protein
MRFPQLLILALFDVLSPALAVTVELVLSLAEFTFTATAAGEELETVSSGGRVLGNSRLRPTAAAIVSIGNAGNINRSS